MQGKGEVGVDIRGMGYTPWALRAIFLGDAVVLGLTAEENAKSSVCLRVRTVNVPISFHLSVRLLTALSLPRRFTGRTQCPYVSEHVSL